MLLPVSRVKLHQPVSMQPVAKRPNGRIRHAAATACCSILSATNPIVPLQLRPLQHATLPEVLLLDVEAAGLLLLYTRKHW
jgi:hypothetical protein